MIIDSLANAPLYASLHPRLAEAFAFLLSAPLDTLPEGRRQIDGENLYLTVSECDLKTPDTAALEAHDVYIDIQIVITGTERYGWRDRASCASPRGGMDTTKDILFFDDRPSTYFTLTARQMTVFFPGDAHAPLVGEGRVRKCIVKVKA